MDLPKQPAIDDGDLPPSSRTRSAVAASAGNAQPNLPLVAAHVNNPGEKEAIIANGGPKKAGANKQKKKAGVKQAAVALVRSRGVQNQNAQQNAGGPAPVVVRAPAQGPVVAPVRVIAGDGRVRRIPGGGGNGRPHGAAAVRDRVRAGARDAVARMVPTPAAQLNTQMRLQTFRIANVSPFFMDFARAPDYVLDLQSYNRLLASFAGVDFHADAFKVFRDQAPAALASVMFPDADFHSRRVATFFFWWQQGVSTAGKYMIANIPGGYPLFHRDLVHYLQAMLLNNPDVLAVMPRWSEFLTFMPVAEAVRQALNDDQLVRFIHCARAYCDFITNECEPVAAGKVPAYGLYHAIRLDAPVSKLLVELMCVVMKSEIHPDVVAHPEWKSMMYQMEIVLSYTRDLFHVKYDLDTNTWTSNVVMVHFQGSKNMDVATANTISQLGAAVATFRQLSAQLELRFFSDLDMLAHVQSVVHGLETIMMGMYAWCRKVPMLQIQSRFEGPTRNVEINLGAR